MSGPRPSFLAALARLTPSIPIVSEEAAAAGRIPSVAGAFWLVDPLDGTKEFLNRNGEFTGFANPHFTAWGLDH